MLLTQTCFTLPMNYSAILAEEVARLVYLSEMSAHTVVLACVVFVGVELHFVVPIVHGTLNTVTTYIIHILLSACQCLLLVNMKQRIVSGYCPYLPTLSYQLKNVTKGPTRCLNNSNNYNYRHAHVHFAI